MFGIDDALLGTGVSSALGFVGGLLGNQSREDIASSASASSAEQAQRQMDFQERMSDTQYQRGTKDLIAAGLNPMLAYTHGGGASTPQGAMGQVYVPQYENPGDSAARAGAAASSTYGTLSSAGKAQAETDSIRQEMGSFDQRMRNLVSEGKLTDTREALTSEQRELTVQEKLKVIRDHTELMPAQIVKLASEAAHLDAQAENVRLKRPEMVVEAKLWASELGPLLKQLEKSPGVDKLLGGTAVQSAAELKSLNDAIVQALSRLQSATTGPRPGGKW